MQYCTNKASEGVLTWAVPRCLHIGIAVEMCFFVLTFKASFTFIAAEYLEVVISLLYPWKLYISENYIISEFCWSKLRLCLFWLFWSNGSKFSFESWCRNTFLQVSQSVNTFEQPVLISKMFLTLAVCCLLLYHSLNLNYLHFNKTTKWGCF